MAHAPDPPAFPAVASTALATSSREAGRPFCRPAGRSAQQPAARGAKGNRPGWDERGAKRSPLTNSPGLGTVPRTWCRRLEPASRIFPPLKGMR